MRPVKKRERRSPRMLKRAFFSADRAEKHELRQGDVRDARRFRHSVSRAGGFPDASMCCHRNSKFELPRAH